MTSNINLCCSLCSNPLISSVSPLCFYEKDLTTCHLILKPEFLQLPSPLKSNTIQMISQCPFIKQKSNIIVFEESNSKSKQAYKLYCKFCGVVPKKHIGSLVTIGPNNEGVFCFSFSNKDKAGSYLHPHTPKAFKWKETQAYINNLIEKRKEHNFEVFNVLIDPRRDSEMLFLSRIPLSKSYLKINEMKLAAMNPRDYQIESFSHSIVSNSIVCLPTGTGKTLVAFMFLRFFSHQNPSKLAVFLAPKIALIQQQYAKFAEEIINPNTKAFYLTSETTYEERENFINEFKDYIEKKDFSKNYYAFLTPQIFYNMIAGEEMFFHNCCAIVFDEAHHTSKSNPYMKIMDLYCQIREEKLKPALLGLTASLAGEEDFEKTVLKIQEIASNLKSRPFIPIVFTKELEGTKNSIDILTHCFEMNDTERNLKEALESFITNYAKDVLQIKNVNLSKKQTFFSQLGNIDPAIKRNNESLITLLNKLMTILDCNKRLGSSKSIDLLKTLVSSENETQFDLKSDFSFFLEIEKEVSSNVAVLCQILKDNFIQEDQYDSRALVFVKERYTAKWLSEQLAKDDFLSKFVPSYSVGQNGILGMSWQDQNRSIIRKFEIGLVKILVATNVLEEGIDITACNLVVRFEGKMNLRSFIQSQGRARKMKSTFVIISHKTEDELRILEKKQENMEKAMRLSMVRMSSEEADQIKIITNTVKTIKENQFVIKEKYSNNQQINNEERKVFHSLPKGEFLIEAFIFGKKDINSKIIIDHVFHLFASVKQLSDQSSSLVQMVVCDQEQFGNKLTITNFYFPFLSKCNGFSYNESGLWINWREESKEADNNQEIQEIPVKNLEINIACGFFVSRELFYQSDYVFKKAALLFTKRYFLLQIEYCTYQLYYPWLFKIGLESIEKDSGMLSLYLTTTILPFAFSSFEEGQSIKANRLTDGGIRDWTKFFSFRLVFNLNLDASRNFYLKFRANLIKNRITLYGTRVNIRLWESQNSFTEKNIFESNLDVYFEYLCLKTQYAHFLGAGFPNGAAFSILKQIFDSYGHAEIVEIFGLLKKLIVNPFDNFEELANKAIEQYERKSKLNLLKKKHEEVVNNLTIHSILKIVITPGRTIYQNRIPVFSNRILRQFGETDKFVIVQFLDEDYNLFPNSDDPLDKLQKVFRNGLLIDDKLYRFLSSSNAQIKNMSIWLTNYDPLMIINWIGDFSKFKNVGKMIARIGLSLGSNISTIKVKDEVLDSERILEDKNDSNGNVFTDGIGMISQNAANKIFEMLKRKNYFISNSNLVHSALQIRLAGCKGVLSISPILDEKLNPESKNEEIIGFDQIIIRKSMYKYDSLHRTIEVNNISSPILSHLNRQIIMLLSNLGIKDEIFLGMLLEDLKRMGQMFREVNIAKKELMALPNPSILIRKPIISSIQSISEPFIKSLLIAIYNKKASKLRKKANISVPEGRLMMGVIDETDSLEYGEVYLNYSEKTYEPQLHEESYIIKNIQGHVVVVKNPCLHPGDVRILIAKPTASVSKNLHHFTDCVVFPAKGKRPHTNEISGSDLDGDLYTVIWDKNLIPSVDSMEEAANYESNEENKKINGEINMEDMIQFLVTYYKEISLGKIANFHLAQSDLYGVTDPKCLRLAQLHSEAVDYIKTGKPPIIEDDVIPKEYPDFMEKQEFEKSYESEKILGILYRRSKFLNKLKPNSHNIDNLTINNANNIDQSIKEKHLKETEIAYYFYKVGMNNIQELFGIESEAEIITGEIITFHSHLKNGDTFKLAELAKAKFQELITQTINEYFLEGKFEDLATALASTQREYFIEKANFWYDYVYHLFNETDLNGVVQKYYSFPWIVQDALFDRFPSSSLKEVDAKDDDMYVQLNDSLKRYFMESSQWLFQSFISRTKLMKKIQRFCRISFQDCKLRLHGSTSFFLFDHHSDIDFCLLLGKKYRIDHQKRESAVQVLKLIYKKIINEYPSAMLILGAKVPIIRSTGDKNSFDITISRTGYRKTLLLIEYYKAYPFLIPLLFAMVRWARYSDIIHHERPDSEEPFMNTYGFIWLFISFCIEKGVIDEIEPLSDCVDENDFEQEECFESLLRLSIDKIGQSEAKNMTISNLLISKLMINFLEDYFPNKRQKNLKLKDPVKDDFVVDIEEKAINLLFEKFMVASHTLSVYQNINHWINSMTCKLTVKLKKNAMFKLEGREVLFASSMASDYNVEVNFSRREKNMYFNNYKIHLFGIPENIFKAKKLIDQLNEEVFRINTEHLRFEKEASLLLFAGSLKDSDEVGYIVYHGLAKPQHIRLKLHRFFLHSPIAGDEWAEFAYDKFRIKLQKQYDALLKQRNDIDSLSAFNVLVRVGRFYFIEADKFKDASLTVSDLEAHINIQNDRNKHVSQLRKEKMEKLFNMMENNTLNDLSDEEIKERKEEVYEPPKIQDFYDSEEEFLAKFYKKNKKNKKNKKVNKKLGCAFFTSVITSEKVFEEYLKAQNYSWKNKGTYYKAAILKKGITVNIYMDENFNVLNCNECKLHWFSGILIPNTLDTQRQETVRFYISSFRNFERKIKPRILTLNTDEKLGKNPAYRIILEKAFEGKVHLIRKIEENVYWKEGLEARINRVEETYYPLKKNENKEFGSVEKFHIYYEFEIFLKGKQNLFTDLNNWKSTMDIDNFTKLFWRTGKHLYDFLNNL